MLTGHCFKHIRNRRSKGSRIARPSEAEFLALLSERVGERFARISGLNIQAVAVTLPTPESAEEPPELPDHPACAEFAQSDYCRESWQLHLAELKDQPESHWHTCDYGLRCAVVPVVCSGRCLAACRLISPDSMPENSFAEYVEVLDVLVSDFAERERASLSRFLASQQEAEGHDVLSLHSTGRPTKKQSDHPKVLQATEYIETHLSDPKLSVGHIAERLNIHADYLANLFAKQVGRRMSRYIAVRRVERAKNLLATTSWQIKRVAHESGFAHPNWFCHVFNSHTGMTPTKYRQIARAQQPRSLRIA